VRELLLSKPDADTVLRGDPTEPKCVAWSAPIPLGEIKRVGARLCGTVNDVLLTAVSGALRRYLQERGDTLSGGPIRALVPITLRPSGAERDLGNKIGMVLLPLPVDVPDPLDRFRELKKRMDVFKSSLGAPIVYAAMNTFGRAPSGLINPFVDHICSRATVVVTNVKGPQEPLYLAGAPLEEFMFWIPRFGGIGLGIGFLSYAGTVRVGVISDRDVVPDPEGVITAFHHALETLFTMEQAPVVPELAPKVDDVPTATDEIPTGGNA
jgi:WS/DGAT/MGAT family acyltransferase